MWLLDLGTSVHFTTEKISLSMLNMHHNTIHKLQMEKHLFYEGTVIVNYKGSSVCLLLVIYMPTCNLKLISMGMLVKDNCLTINAGPSHIDFFDKCAKKIVLSFYSHGTDTMFWMHAPTMSPQATQSLAFVDYDLLHHHMGHPSKDVLRAARKHLKDFPDVKIPMQDPICPGC
jgi:hypothetical protein